MYLTDDKIPSTSFIEYPLSICKRLSIDGNIFYLSILTLDRMFHTFIAVVSIVLIIMTIYLFGYCFFIDIQVHSLILTLDYMSIA